MFCRFRLLFIAIIIISGTITSAVRAQSAEIITPSQFMILIDHDTAMTLYEKNADALMKPASMAKLMTTYIAFQQIKDGGLKLDDMFIVSQKAYKRGGSRTFIEFGEQVSVADLLRGVIVQSGNDAAIALAEGLAGTEDAFAQQMTETAKELGMENTIFGNATGWPDEITRTTARDLAILSRALIAEFPELYKLFAEKTFTFNDIKQSNRNPLIGNVNGADGLKTGHTMDSGYGLAASAERDGQRLIMVINGLNSKTERKQEGIRLMNLAFRVFKKFTLLDSNEILAEAPVLLGLKSSVALSVPDTITRVMRRKDHTALVQNITIAREIKAPVSKGQRLGEVVLTIGDDVERYPLVAMSDVEQLPLHRRLIAFLEYIIFGYLSPPQTGAGQ